MADTKITALTAISTVDPAVDVLAIVDVSDTTMAASGTTKKITSNQLLGAGGTATLASATITGAATVGTTLGVTGASTFTGAATFTGNTTLGDAQTDTATINGQLTARQGEFPSAVRAAASDYAAVAFDGATASTRIASGCQAIGTGAFSLWSRFRVPASNPASSIGIIGLSSTNSTMLAANAVLLSISSSGTLNFLRYGATTSDVRQAIITGFLSTYSGQVVDVVVTRTGATLKIYVNGTDTAYTETTGGTPPAWSDTIASDFCNVGCFTSGATTIFTGRIYRSVVFNRALSAADVTELITVGVNPADQWGTQTQIANTTTLNGGFETAGGGGADPFANWGEFTSGTTTITRDTVVFSPNLSSTASANITTDALNSVGSLSLPNVWLPSKRFRLLFDFRHNGTAAAGPQYNIGSGSDIVGTATAPNTWTSYVVELIASGTSLGFTRSSGAGASKTSWYDNTIIERIGAIVDLDFTIGGGTTAFDRSTNALDGTLFGGVSWTMPQEGQYINGPSTITGALTVDTSTLVVDAANDRVGIGTPTPAAKLIVRDGTNRNLLVSSDATQLGSAGIAIGGFTDNAAGYAPLSLLASSMQFGIGGTPAMTLNASGSVGIGQTPSDKFNVRVSPASGAFAGMTVNDSTNVIGLMITGSAYNSFGVGANSGWLYAATNNMSIGPYGAGYVSIVSNGAERIRFAADGNAYMTLQGAVPTIPNNAQMVFNLTSNTNLRISVKGSDGTTRTANITLA